MALVLLVIKDCKAKPDGIKIIIYRIQLESVGLEVVAVAKSDR